MKERLDRYKIHSKLGEGEMATVHLAEDIVLSRLVAIKSLRPILVTKRAIVERFFREARMIASIKSVHVIDIHDIGQSGKEPFMVMEFVDGQTLQKLFDQIRPDLLDAKVAAALLWQVSEGLIATAKHGIVHRDLKPANMLITEGGYLKIADFGLAHLKGETVTPTGTVLGPQLFMSPEQTQGTKPITPQSDLFSIGSVFYYLLTRRPAFYAEDTVVLRQKIISKPHVPLQQLRPDMHPDFCRLIDILLHKNPEQRGSPQWLKRQLQKFLFQQNIIDPTEEVAAFVKSLSGRGFLVTSEIERNALAAIIAGLEKGKKKVPMMRRSKVALFLWGTFILSAAIGGSLLWIFLR